MSGVLTDKPVRIGISSTPDHLCVVRAAIERVCLDMGFGEQRVTEVILSVDEALSNVIRHAYGGDPGQPIEIELSALPSGGAGLQVRICDRGRTVESHRIKSRDLDDVRPGGLGVHIMNECMDHVEYQHAEEGGTVLTMVKRLPSAMEGTD